MERICIASLSDCPFLYDSALSFVRIYEDVCCRLYSLILEKSDNVYLLYDSLQKVQGVFFFGKGNLLLPCLPRDFPELRQALRSFLRGKKVFCISGKAEFAALLRDCLFCLGRQSLLESRDYDFFETEAGLCKNFGERLPDFDFAKASLSDSEKLFPLQLAYVAEEVLPSGLKMNRAAERLSLDRALKKGNVYGLKDKEGNFACKLQVNALSDSFALIGGVYTLPGYRRRGLARILLGSVIECNCISHKGTVLFADKTNAPALALYKACGFKVIDDYTVSYWS